MLSLNIGEEAGLVAPYIAANHYAFPVMLGKDVLRGVPGEDGVAIPQNWFVAPQLQACDVAVGI